MKLEVGKYYQHNGGGMLHALAIVETTGYGTTLIAEEFGSWQFKPCGMDEASAVNWFEIDKEVWDLKLKNINETGVDNDSKNGIHPSRN